MGQIAEMIVTPAKRARLYAERILNGITPQTFARKPRLDERGKVVDTNHPAWVYGHLALYPARALQILGVDSSKAAVPAAFEGLFKDGTVCQDDPEGKIYPAMEAVTSAFFRSHDAAFEAIAGLDDKVLTAPSDEKARANFPLVGGRIIFYLNNHVMMHMGQISTWRRCMGLPPA